MFFRYFLNLAAIFVSASTMVVPGPSHPPTKGEIWPAPLQQNKTNDYYQVDIEDFTFEVTGLSCSILEKAIARYKGIMTDMRHLIDAENGTTSLKMLETTTKHMKINLSSPCERHPHIDMDESYTLTIDHTSELTSNSIWGILRGLESFSQSLYYDDDFKEVRVNKTSIVDSPRYTHRGLLIDTSRHYLPIKTILKVVDAMTYNKLNVFHWHIVDDQSFPYASDVFPELSKKGAYYKSAVYTTENIKRIVSYARNRGIRVVPEFDVPGHTRSWGVAYPHLLTECYANGQRVGLGPMNPIKREVYDFLRVLLREVDTVFGDEYIHVGGDEVEHSCWLSNPQIRRYMDEYNIKDADGLHNLFMHNVIPLLPSGRKAIVWQEVFDSKVMLPNNSVVQMWKDTNANTIVKIVKKGYGVLISTCWYLDHITSGGDWERFYLCDPRSIPHTESARAGIIGGEACMWGEVVDDSNVISRIWPRASAAAERLWSHVDLDRWSPVPDLVRSRLEEHACRMKRRGVQAQPPNGPGFCRY